jgi:hypothetical protein
MIKVSQGKLSRFSLSQQKYPTKYEKSQFRKLPKMFQTAFTNQKKHAWAHNLLELLWLLIGN